MQVGLPSTELAFVATTSKGEMRTSRANWIVHRAHWPVKRRKRVYPENLDFYQHGFTHVYS